MFYTIVKILDFRRNFMARNKIIQFGYGNFLRAFVDYYLNLLKKENLLDSGVTLIKATPHSQSQLEEFKAKNYKYTLIERGIEKGEVVSQTSIVDIISESINPYENFELYLECAKSEDLRFVISNTTESGIVYDKNCKFEDEPQNSFPGKVTRLLFERYEHFNGDMNKGLVFLPCELIDNNGLELKKIILKHSTDWDLGIDFENWIVNANIFTNTLVDRIVPGFPKNEIDSLEKTLGYVDNFAVTSEIFNFWAIEGPSFLKEELPFHKLGLNIIWTEDVKPYKSRKVRILNGGHTSTILGAYLAGFDTVGEMMNNENFEKLLYKILFDEVIPTLDLPKDDLIDFANSVFDRFKNPFIEHFLMDISLNSISKYKVRVVPSIIDYYKTYSKIPTGLTFSFATLIVFYRGIRCNGEEINLRDDKTIIEYFKNIWKKYDNKEFTLNELIVEISSNDNLFGYKLNELSGFVDLVEKYTCEIFNGNFNFTDLISKIETKNL